MLVNIAERIRVQMSNANPFARLVSSRFAHSQQLAADTAKAQVAPADPDGDAQHSARENVDGCKREAVVHDRRRAAYQRRRPDQ